MSPARQRRLPEPGRRGRGPRVQWLRRLLVTLALGALAGCAHRPPPVQPWQREHLARRSMRFDAPTEVQEDRFRQHWFGAREGSDLGFGQPGGGCGCN
jgi:hypothetical protein